MSTPRLFAVLTLFFCHAVVAKQPVVVIDAANGGTEWEVQAALDTNPAGTTFLLVGDFYFSEPVFIEKSDTTIRGDMRDNGNGVPGPEDDWQTTIYGTSAAFVLSPRGFAQVAYNARNISISGINFKLPAPVYNNPNLDCGVPIEPYSLDGVVFQNNSVDGGLSLFRNASHVSIDNNLFTGQYPLNPVNLVGTAIRDCFPFNLPTTQLGNAVTNNTFDSTSLIYIGVNSGLTIASNQMLGIPVGQNRILLFQIRDVVVRDNVLYGDSSANGLTLYTRNLNPNLPGEFSSNIDITGNTFVDMYAAVAIYGGISNSSIKGNHISQSGAFAPNGFLGIAMADNTQNIQPVLTNSSSRVRITNNHVQNVAFSGIFLNGETSGVSIENNTFLNPGVLYGDVTLAPTDLIFGADLCPANDNTVIATNFSTTVSDVGENVCSEDSPNRLLGALKLIYKDVSQMPPEAQSHMESLIQLNIDSTLGRPQGYY